MFEQASREKLRFSVEGRGQLSVEDLWDLDRVELDRAYRVLAEATAATETGSLISPRPGNAEATLKMRLINHVFQTKKAERLAAANKLEVRARLNRLIEIKAQRQDAALGEMSEEDMDALIQELSTQA